MGKDEIARAILQHLARCPGSADTLEGIAEWWIRQERIAVMIEDVCDVVERLVREGVLQPHLLRDSTTVYFASHDTTPDSTSRVN